MSVSIRPFGATKAGTEVRAYTIDNNNGASCTVLDYGAIIQALCVPDRKGQSVDVVLGYDTAAEYETGRGHLGGMIGRYANRIGGARFSLNGKEYLLEKNNGDNCLHGGSVSYDHMMWETEIPDDYTVRFSRFSPDGEQGFPGNLRISVTYRMAEKSADLFIDYDAVCDSDTLYNPTNHSYFDLSGCGKAMEQTLWINAQRYLEISSKTLPTGVQAPVEGTPFDFRQPKPVGRDIDKKDGQLRLGGGYDHNFCIAAPHAARLESAETGIRMDVYTSMPGMQLYSGNFLGKQKGKKGIVMCDRGAVALETQLWPDSMNHWGFPSAVLRSGEQQNSKTAYCFSIMD